MGLKAGSVEDFADSMAEAMERALAEQWEAMGRGVLPDAGAKDRRLMFAAIARGMLCYLKSQEAAGVHLISQLSFKRPDPQQDAVEEVVGVTWNLDDLDGE